MQVIVALEICCTQSLSTLSNVVELASECESSHCYPLCRAYMQHRVSGMSDEFMIWKFQATCSGCGWLDQFCIVIPYVVHTCSKESLE